MKKLMMAAALTALLAGCSGDNYEPKEINAATDICEICQMSISNEEFAGQIVFKNGDHEVYDDLGCLMAYINEHGEDEIGAAYIKDEAMGTWVNIKEATYIYDADFWTPMNYGVLAFTSSDDAQAYMTEAGEGEELAYKDLATFEWGIHTHE